MKKMICMIISLLLVTSALASCVGGEGVGDTTTGEISDTTAEETTTEGATNTNHECFELSGRVLKTTAGNYFLVIDTDGVLKKNDLVLMRPSEGVSLKALFSGDRIKISVICILESYPAQTDVQGLELIEQGKILDVPAEVIAELEGLGHEVDYGREEETTDGEGEPQASDYGEQKKAPELPSDVINAVDDWGVLPGKGHATDNSVTLLAKFAEMPDGATVYFPTGEYELAFPMLVQGKKNIRIVGHNATLVRTGTINTAAYQPPVEDERIPEALQPATGMTSVFCAMNVDGLTVEGFKLKYDTPTSLSGKIVSVSGGSAVIEITDGSRLTGGEYVTVINTFDDDRNPDRTLEQYAAENFPCEKIDDKTVKISGIDVGGATNLRPGMNICLRLCSGRDYVMTFNSVNDFTARDLVMYNSYNGGMMFVERCKNITIENFAVKPENAGSLMTLNADVIHIADMEGKLRVEDCYFERQGDDAVNVHSMAYIVGEKSGSSLTLTSPRYAMSVLWGGVGDTLGFYDKNTFEWLGDAEITAVDGDRFTFDALPDGVTSGAVASNASLSPEVYIGRCVVKSVRARGFLLQTENVTVEDCKFYNTALSAILISPDIANWYEMGPVKNARILNNTFVGCGKYSGSVIEVTTSHNGDDTKYDAYIHGSIEISKNKFKGGGSLALFASCAQSVRFVDNDLSEGYAEKPVCFRHCGEVILPRAFEGRVDATDTEKVMLI